MRVNGFLSHVSGITQIKLYDEYCIYVNDMSVNEYFQEEYDKSFVEYELNRVSVQDGMLNILIRKVDQSEITMAVDSLKECLEVLQENLDEFTERYL